MKRFLLCLGIFSILIALSGCGDDPSVSDTASDNDTTAAITQTAPSTDTPTEPVTTEPDAAPIDPDSVPTEPEPILPQPCDVCQDTKYVVCSDCDGNGYNYEGGFLIFCKACNGSVLIPCSACCEDTPSDDPIPDPPSPTEPDDDFNFLSKCGNCLSGLVRCDVCDGSGTIEKVRYDEGFGEYYYYTDSCDNCNSRGMVVCPDCKLYYETVE